MSTDERLHADKQTIAGIFSTDKFYIIPPFQRRFVWDRENFQQLIEDLWEAFETEKDYYFLGSIVLSKEDRNTYKVIDGQQRLITLSLLFATLFHFIKKDGILDDDNYLAKLHEKIYSPENEVDGIPEDFRIKYEIPETRPESQEYENILRGDVKNFEHIKYQNFKEALTVFYDWLKDRIDSQNNLKDFVRFLNKNTYMVVISTQEVETAINIFNVINSRGLPLANADLIKSHIYEKLADEIKRKEFIKEWERLETVFSEERYGQSEFDAILGFIRSFYNPQKPKEALYKEYENLIRDNKLEIEHFKDILVEVAQLYEELIKNFNLVDTFNISGKEKTRLKNIITILREFYPTIEWMSAVVWFYKIKGDNKFLDFVEAIEKKLYLDWLTGKTPTERLKPVYEVLQALKEGKDTDEILGKLVSNLPNKKDIEFHLDDENFYGRFRGKLAKYTLLRIEYDNKERDKFEYTENITVEHILPRKPTDEWKAKFRDDYEKFINMLGNLTLIKGELNSKMKNKPFEEKKKLLMEERGKEFSVLNEELLQRYNQWTKNELKKRHEELKKKVLKIYFVEASP